MAEGAPLLREYVGKTCIEGSNPSDSARKLGNTGLRGPFYLLPPKTPALTSSAQRRICAGLALADVVRIDRFAVCRTTGNRGGWFFAGTPTRVRGLRRGPLQLLQQYTDAAR